MTILQKKEATIFLLAATRSHAWHDSLNTFLRSAWSGMGIEAIISGPAVSLGS